MSMDAVFAFWKRVDSDRDLKKRVEGAKAPQPAASAAQLEGLVAIARGAGFDCTAEELRAAESVSRFWERANHDEALQKSLAPADGLPRPEAIKLILGVANQAGFQFSLDQLDAITKAKVAAGRGGQLDDDQLEAVAGGADALMMSTVNLSLNFTSPVLNKIVNYYT
jgi:predicted ribosomally synthesized peptide with nif11-like leader